MDTVYTEDNLDELRDYVQFWTGQYDLTVAARESVYETVEGLLTGPNNHIQEVPQGQVDSWLENAIAEEATGGTYDDVAPEDSIVVDLTYEDDVLWGERENFSDWSDEKAEERIEEVQQKFELLFLERTLEGQ